MRNTIVAACVVLVALPAWSASISPISQTREVSGSAFASDPVDSGNDSDSAQAPDFGPFVEARSAQVVLGGAIGSGGGEQNSTIGPNGIVASGSAFATAESFEDFANADGSGETTLQVSFMVPQASFYRITGFIEAFDSGFAELNLSGPQGLVFDSIAFGPAQTNTLDETGMLMPGLHTYTLSADGSAFADFFGMEFAFSAFDVELLIASAGPGGDVPGLRVDRLAAGDVRLRWGPSCRPDDVDYEVYEGQIGDFAGSALVVCSTGGLRTLDTTPSFDASFYLIVPTDGATEGSYGRDSTGSERPAAAAPCRAQSLGDPVCP